MTKPVPGHGTREETAPVSAEVLPLAGSDPEPDEVERLAYQYWQQRGRPTGSSEEDWYRAEQEIKLRQQEQAKGDGDRSTS